MTARDDDLRATVGELIATFHQALVSLTPAADRARLPWRDDYQHPSWERLAHELYDAFVAAPIAIGGSGTPVSFPLARFDIDHDDYGQLSWVSPSETEADLALVRFLSAGAPFDTVEFAQVDPQSHRCVRKLRRPWQEAEYVVLLRGEGGATAIIDSIVADD